MERIERDERVEARRAGEAVLSVLNVLAESIPMSVLPRRDCRWPTSIACIPFAVSNSMRCLYAYSHGQPFRIANFERSPLPSQSKWDLYILNSAATSFRS